MVDEDESSGVTDDLDLNGIDTEAKMKKLWKQANDAVKSAKKTEEAREKQEAELQKMASNLLKYEEKEKRAGMFKGGQSPTGDLESELDRSKRAFSEEAGLNQGSPQLFGGSDPATHSGIRKAQGQPPMGQMNEDRLKKLAQDYIHNQKITANTNAIKNIQAKSASVQQNITKLAGLAKSGMGTSGGPMGVFNSFNGMMGGKLGGGMTKLMAMGGIYTAIAVAVYEIGKQIIEVVTEMVMAEFRAGGVFDVRKMVKDEISTIVTLQDMIDREQGMVFFSGDTSEILRQGPPQNANTKQMEYGHKQFVQMFNN